VRLANVPPDRSGHLDSRTSRALADTSARKRARSFVLVSVLAVAVTLLSPAPVASAIPTRVFSLMCSLSHRLSDDPIVFPAQPGAAHLHDFYGNTSVDAFSTYESMLGAGTSCDVSLDTAGYWSPTLIRPSGRPATIQNITLYYRGVEGHTVAYPPDLRIIAGSSAGTPAGTGGDQLVAWRCRNKHHDFATVPKCPTNVKAIVTFPQCWDGVNVDSPDHHSHMAYAVEGKCTGSHPVMVPQLQVHITYVAKGGPGFMLSSDHAKHERGRNLHADFWNTWDQDKLEELVEDCINGTEDCNNLQD
jgi:Domain of unknown function (DUF1996)